ncbi:MAG TPA: ABC transporter family substrate-binding protein [Pseudonocardiaceae bacterium]
MRRSKLVSAMALLATSALVLSACGGGDSGTTGGGQTQNQRPEDIGKADQVFKRPKMDDSGEFTMVREGKFTDYNNNTGASNNFQNTVVLSNLQPSPYFFDLVDNQIVIKLDGDYMESVEVTSEDPMQVTWKVRKEAVWSDGEPFGCKDFYLQWFAATSTAKTVGDDGTEASLWDSSPTGFKEISKLTCADDNKTIVTDFSKPYADYRTVFSGMLPAHVLEREAGIPDITKLTDADTASVQKAAEFYTTGWVGFDPAKGLSAGPYKIESTNDDETVLVRNDKWWAEKGGPSKLTIRVNNDAQSAAQQLQNKEVDVIAIQADGAVAQQLRGDSSIKTFALAGQTYEHIDFRMDFPLFQDKAVRDAVAACVNRQDLIDKLVKDVDPNAKPLGNVMFMPNEFGYEDHYADTGNGDVEAAKKILTDAGYTQGGDGIFAKNGQRVSFRIGHRIVERRSQTVRLMQAHCAPAGIEIIDDQTENFNDERLPASDFDVALFAWVGTAVKSSSYGNYASRDAGGSANYNRYSNPEVDKTFNDANAELDYDKRVEMLNQVNKLMRADMHSLPLFVLPDFTASQADISPISYVGAIGGVTWNLFAWQRG